MSGFVFRVPPTWPPAPSGWVPSTEWEPDPLWPDPPAGWTFWVAAAPGEIGVDRPTYLHQTRPQDTPAVARLGLIAFIIAAVAVVGIVALTITTWTTDRPVFGVDEFLPFFGLSFAEFGLAMWMSHRPRRGRRRHSVSWAEAVGSVPEWLMNLLIAAGVLAVPNFFVSLVMTGTIGGQTSYDAGQHRYELNDHGSITVVSRAAYDHAAAVGGRAFMAGAAVFLLLSMPITLNRWCRLHRPAPDASIGPAAAPGRDWQVSVLGTATYRRRNFRAPDTGPVELRADLLGISLRAHSRWMNDELMPAELRRKGDWYRDWTGVTYIEATDRSLAVHIANSDGFQFTARSAFELADLIRLTRYLAIPTTPPVPTTTE